MSRADPHCHTLASDGMASPAELVAAAVAANLDLIAVTDHDTMALAAEVGSRGEAAGLKVVAGQEITTSWPAQTHLLGWFLERPVASGRALEYTVEAIHDQGGLVIVPHPFMPFYFGSMQPGRLRRLLVRQAVDGIEVIFTAPIGGRRRRALAAFYSQHRDRLGAAIGASDCHFGSHDIGRAVTLYEGDFRAAVLGRTTRPQLARNTSAVPLPLALRQQWRSLVDLPLRRLRGQLQ